MSFIQIHSTSNVRLPRTPSDDSTDEAIIKGTLWKCRRQVYAAATVGLGMFSVGNVFGWASYGMASVIKDGYVEDTAIMKSFMASIFMFAAIGGGPSVGITMRKLGRKPAGIIFSIILAFGWLLITAARAFPWIYASEAMILAGRAVSGYACAASLVVGVVFTLEIVNEDVRTKLGNLVPFFLVLGNTFCFAIGSFTPWWIVSLICSMFPALEAILLCFFPETPRYLLTVSKPEKAEKAFHWYSKGFHLPERAILFKRFKRTVQDPDTSSDLAMTRSDRARAKRRHKLGIGSRPVLQPLLVSTFLVLCQQLSGINVVNTFAKEFLDKGAKFLNPDIAMVIIGVFYFIVVILTVLIVDKLGRKCLIIAGTGTQTVLLVGLGVFFYYAESNDQAQVDFVESKSGFGWVPVFACSIFLGAYALGIGSVCWIIAAEINHPDFAEISGAVNSATYWLIAGVSTATTPYLKELIGYPACFWVYSGLCLIALLYTVIFIYETKGKTQEEIMNHYKGSLYKEEDDHLSDTQSLGSLHAVGSKRYRDKRMSGDSDWSIEFTTLYNPRSEEYISGVG